MNILNWNVKGLSKPKRRRLLKDLLLQHHIDIVSSQKIKRIKFKDRMLNAWRGRNFSPEGEKIKRRDAFTYLMIRLISLATVLLIIVFNNGRLYLFC
jgi:hypothetical protein